MGGQVFAHTHRVTYAECTIGNHVYYARYLDLLEAARGEFFRQIGAPCLELQENGTIFPVIAVSLRYRSVARYDDVLRVELWLTELERVRLTFGCRILRENTVIMEGATTHACTSPEEKLKRVPDELAARLRPYLSTAILQSGERGII